MTTGKLLLAKFTFSFHNHLSVTLFSFGVFCLLVFLSYELQLLFWSKDLCDLLDTTDLQCNSSLMNFTNTYRDL